MTCNVPSCEKRAKARGMCNTHYERWRKHGDPLVGPRRLAANCIVDGCPKPVKSRDLCAAHYWRLCRHGDPLVTIRQYGANRRVAHNGYIHVWRPGHPLAHSNGYVPEHRMVLHDLGLDVDGMQVHHIDHDKANNDPSNLILLTLKEHAQLHGQERRRK